jgi:hypothetical protein
VPASTSRPGQLIAGFEVSINCRFWVSTEGRVAKFRKQVQKMGSWHGHSDRRSRQQAARALITQVQEMLATNLIVRETLEELLTGTKALLRDLEDC